MCSGHARSDSHTSRPHAHLDSACGGRRAARCPSCDSLLGPSRFRFGAAGVRPRSAPASALLPCLSPRGTSRFRPFLRGAAERPPPGPGPPALRHPCPSCSLCSFRLYDWGGPFGALSSLTSSLAASPAAAATSRSAARGSVRLFCILSVCRPPPIGWSPNRRVRFLGGFS